MQPESFKLPIEILNYIFIVIFTIECIMKSIALRCHFFQDVWNIFDLFVVVLTITLVLISAFAHLDSSISSMATILRILRMFRLVRLLRRSPQLFNILKTILYVSPAVGSLSVLLMLFLFMFSIISVQLFAMTNLDGASELGKDANFQSFGTAFITLLRCASGEAWNMIMFDLAQQKSIHNHCVEEEDYYSILAAGRDPSDVYGPRKCGSWISILFHLAFQIVISQVFLNLFIAIIIDAFFGQNDLALLPISSKSIEDFQHVWGDYDKDATGFIDIDKLDAFLIDLAQKQIDEGGLLILFKQRIVKSKIFRRRQLMHLEIPTYNKMKQVMFYDVLMKLCHQSIKLHF